MRYVLFGNVFVYCLLFTNICGKQGKCNRLTGQCECRSGLTGPACDRGTTIYISTLQFVVIFFYLLISNLFIRRFSAVSVWQGHLWG